MTPKSKTVDCTKRTTTMRHLHIQCQLQQGGSNDLLLQRNSSDFEQSMSQNYCHYC